MIQNLVIKSYPDLKQVEYESLVELDQALYRKYLDSFAEAAWSTENFKMLLEGKQFLSEFYFLPKLHGYCIASYKMRRNVVWIHRFSLTNMAREKKQVILNCFIEKHKRVMLMVSIKNKAAIKFYQNSGFRIKHPEELVDFTDLTRGLKVENGRFKTPLGNQVFIMGVSLE